MQKRTKTSLGIGILVLILVIMASCSGGGTQRNADETPQQTTDSNVPKTSVAPATEAKSFPLPKQILIKYATVEHATFGRFSWAEDGSPGFQWLEQQTNIKLDVNHIPRAGIQERLQLMLSSNQLPDLLSTAASGWTHIELEQAGNAGLLVNILDEKYKHLIPNYLKWIESTPALQAMVYEGKLYGFYNVEANNPPFSMSMPYRKDLFDKYNLQPETWDELYEALKLLKSEYPDSYPFGAFEQGGTIVLLEFGPSNFRSGRSVYFNDDKQEWVYGPLEENYKLYLEFFAKLYKEGILNPEFATMTYEQWSQSWIEGETMFSWWWSIIANGFTADNPTNNPNYGPESHWVETHRVPSFVKGGQRGWAAQNAPMDIYNPKVISTNSQYIEEILMLMDFLSDTDNSVSTYYGPKGVEWDVIDGKYRWIAKEIQTPYNPEGTQNFVQYYSDKYGVKSVSHNNFITVVDSKVGMDLNDVYSDPHYVRFLEATEQYLEDGSTKIIPQPLVRFSDEELEKQVQLKTALDTYSDEMSIKIINGSLPLSEIETMQKQLVEMGANELVGLYKKASGK